MPTMHRHVRHAGLLSNLLALALLTLPLQTQATSTSADATKGEQTAALDISLITVCP
tara:strand:- start:640 stop:810 length:171 start_codon:yes stop_codon:yes gene_type:complete